MFTVCDYLLCTDKSCKNWSMWLLHLNTTWEESKYLVLWIPYTTVITFRILSSLRFICLLGLRWVSV